MDLISQIPLIGGFLATVLPFVLVLGIVVFVHEYGHYIVARWCGIYSEVFSIGFGPVIWARRDRRGTIWQVAAIPLGGYVKFLGDSDGASRADPEALAEMDAQQRSRSFHGAAVWKRMLTVLAGPAANFLLTIFVFAGVIMWQGVPDERPIIGSVSNIPQSLDPLKPGDVVLEINGTQINSFADILVAAVDMDAPAPMDMRVERGGEILSVISPYTFPPLVSGVEPLSPASSAGLLSGDYILEADGHVLHGFSQLREVVMASGGKTIPLKIWRDGAELMLDIAPLERDAPDGNGGYERRVMIGVVAETLYNPQTETPAPWTALGLGALRMIGVITQSLDGLRHIIIGNLGAENLQGPLGIAQISGETAQQGGLSLIILIGVISTAIGMINLFPIPVLDGGHFLVFLIEAVRGKPPSPAILQIAMSIGLGLILLLMVFATYNDIMRLMS